MQVSTEQALRQGPITRGWITAIVLTLIFGLGAFFSPFPAVFQFVVFLVVSIGLRRRRKWPGYGGALYLSALIVIYLLKAETGILLQGLAIMIGLLTVAAVFLFRAALAADDRRGSLAPWIVLTAVVVLFAGMFDAYFVPTGAMEKTILIGDYVLAQRVAPGMPKRGDMIVFRYPVDPSQVFVKRVAAVGGDRVQLKSKKVYVNGAARDEPYVQHLSDLEDSFRDNFPGEPNVHLSAAWEAALTQHVSGGELLVPQGKYFVLGDNRDSSLDSRYWGFVDRSQVLGKPVLIYFSTDAPNLKPADTGSFPRPILFHPSSIRWSRIFKRL